LYLWHWPVFAVTRPELDLDLSGAPLFALRLVLTFVVSELCYRFIELPIRGGALSRRRARPLVLGASAALLAALAAGLVSLSGALTSTVTRAVLGPEPLGRATP
jgi:peptidoglycan/LPS O-acetylase OafA/YrhL